MPVSSGCPFQVTVPDTACLFVPPPQPASPAGGDAGRRDILRRAWPAPGGLVVADHFAALGGAQRPPGQEVDRVGEEPHRPVAQGRVDPAGVPAAGGVGDRLVGRCTGRSTGGLGCWLLQ